MSEKTRRDPVRVEQFLRARKEHPNVSAAELSRITGLPETSVRRYCRIYKAETTTEIPVPGTKKVSEDCVELCTENPTTLEELLAACNVDQKVWRVSRWVANKWEVGTKLDSGEVLRTPLFQVKAWLERIPGAAEADVLREVLDDIRERTPFIVPAIRQKTVQVEDPHLLEVSLADLHFDRLTWGEESGENWDMEISRQVAMQAVKRLLDLASPFAVTKILYVLGNDLFTADTPGNTTTAGTPQTADGRWQKSFKRGIQLQVTIIEHLRQRAPVDILVVPGNHDTCRTFYLGCVMEALYSKSGDVNIVNSPALRKYYRWGTVLLGFAHGHSEKHASLPLIMASEAASDWADTTHHELHLGHFHHKRETQFHAGNEVGPVRVRILPSLTGTDAWHSQQGYVGAKKASEAYLWSASRGYVGHLNFSSEPRSDLKVWRAA